MPMRPRQFLATKAEVRTANRRARRRREGQRHTLSTFSTSLIGSTPSATAQGI